MSTKEGKLIEKLDEAITANRLKKKELDDAAARRSELEAELAGLYNSLGGEGYTIVYDSEMIRAQDLTWYIASRLRAAVRQWLKAEGDEVWWEIHMHQECVCRRLLLFLSP